MDEEFQFADYYDSECPIPFRVLGLRLRPWCLGHRLNLIRIESPFVFGEAESASDEDLLKALIVCACDWRQGLELFDHPEKLRHEIARWKRLVVRKLFLFRRKLPWESAHLIFRESIRLGNFRPKVFLEDGGKRLGAPFELALKSNLLPILSEDEIMNMYLPKLWFIYYARMEWDRCERFLWSIQDAMDDAAAQASYKEKVGCSESK